MKAILRNYRQSPRKVALAASLVRGKTAGAALIQLKFATKRVSFPMIKLIESAMSNAKNSGVSNPESLFIQEIRVDKGVTLKRMMPRARGSAARILKRSSHVMLTLSVLGKGKGRAKDAASSKAKVVTKDAGVIAPKTDKKAKAPTAKK